jgi:5-formyltetrahydrofolate cyclo-ligase
VVGEDDKSAWRARVLAARRLVPAEVRAAEAVALARWVRALSGTVCAFWPVGSEPGSALMLDALLDAGCRVLLPVVEPGAALDWAVYRGPDALVTSRSGLRLLEPAGPRLGSLAVAEAATVLVPALAVDRLGVRLGRGAGYYDRSLVLASPGAAKVAVVRDEEVMARLPRAPHDVLMTAALTPGGGFTPLG